MEGLSRRMFLRKGSLVVAGAGVLAAMPTAVIPEVLGSAESAVPAAESATTGLPEAGTLAEPLIAHLRDLGTGEIGIFSGTRAVTVRDPQLAARLFRAAR
ncbi:MAG: hypothetical protein ACRDZQ_08840 [Acidimicrobiales bacterium]